MEPSIRLAGCVIRDTHGRVLLLHRNTATRQQWEIPGGKIEPDEDAATAAVREVLEELGVTVTIGRLLGTSDFLEDDRPLTYTYFVATIVQGTPRIVEPDTHDYLEYLYLKSLAALPASLPASVTALSPATRALVAHLQAGDFTW